MHVPPLLQIPQFFSEAEAGHMTTHRSMWAGHMTGLAPAEEQQHLSRITACISANTQR